MADDFNAYYAWLGVPLAEQPPNHYRLLGVALFEPDLQVISHAADRQMGFVRTFQTGKHAADSQRILNELAAAKLNLLNANRRTEYDAKLRASLASKQAPAAPPVPPAPSSSGIVPRSGARVPPSAIMAPTSIAPSPLDELEPELAPIRPVVAVRPVVKPSISNGSDATDTATQADEAYELVTPNLEAALAEDSRAYDAAMAVRNAERDKQRRIRLAIGLFLFFAFLAAVLTFHGGGEQTITGTERDGKTHVEPKPESPRPSTPPSTAKGADHTTPKPSQTPVAPPRVTPPKPVSPPSIAPPVTPPAVPTPDPEPKEPAVEPPKPTPTSVAVANTLSGDGKGTDLLAALAASRERLALGWHWDGKVLVCEASKEAPLQVFPVKLPDEFDLDIDAERVPANVEVAPLAIIAPFHGTYYDLLIDRDLMVGIGHLHGPRGFTAAGKGTGQIFRMGLGHCVHLQFGDEGWYGAGQSIPVGTVAATFESKDQLTDRHLAIGSTQAIRIKKLELRPYHEKVVEESREKSPPRTPQGTSENLVRLIDPKKDVLAGNWEFDGTSLVTEGHRLQWRAIEFPFVPVEPYRVTLTCEFGAADRPFLLLGLPKTAKSRHETFTVGIDPHGPIPILTPPLQSPRAEVSIPRDEKQLTLVCTVQASEIQIECNGQPVESWTASQTYPNSKVLRKVGIDAHAIYDRLDRIFLDCKGVKFTLRELKYEQLKP